MAKPLLTVCLITYNQENYIKQALDSIMMQKTNFDWELIIADDHSTDGTTQILQEYKKKYPNQVKLILQKKNVGPENNWLDLMEQPKSKYVLYVEGDDYFTDITKFQRQVDFLEANDDFSLCFHTVDVKYQDEPNKNEVFPSPKERFNKNVLDLDDLLARNFIQTNSVMYRWRFVNENIRDVFPRNIVPGDWYLHILLAQTGKIGFIDRTMSVYRKHAGGVWWDIAERKENIYRKYNTRLVALYVALLKVFKDSPKRTEIINTHVMYLLNKFAEIDNEHSTDLIELTAKEFPELIISFIHQQKRFTDKEIARLTKDVDELKTVYQKTLADFTEVNDELIRITRKADGRIERAIQVAHHPIKSAKKLHSKK